MFKYITYTYINHGIYIILVLGLSLLNTYTSIRKGFIIEVKCG